MVAWNMLINIFSKMSITEDEAPMTWENGKARWDLCSSELEFCWRNFIEVEPGGEVICDWDSKYWAIQLGWWDKAAILGPARTGQVVLLCTAIFLSELITILSMQFFVKLCDEGFFPLPDSKLDGKDCACLVSHIVPEPSKTPWTNVIIVRKIVNEIWGGRSQCKGPIGHQSW